MPSFKKVLKAQRTPHRERGQLRERKQFGFLQKKKDYKIRAERAREKQKKIKQLHQEALDRNPDEFFYKMITQTKQRKKVFEDFEESDDPETDPNEKGHLHRDANYVSWKLLIEKKKVDKVLERLRLTQLPAKPMNKHIIFVDDEKPISNSPKSAPFKTDADEISRLKQELKDRRRQLKELRIVSDKLAVQKNLLVEKDAKKELVSQDTINSAAIYKWKPMRKK